MNQGRACGPVFFWSYSCLGRRWTHGAPGTQALGCECPPAPACGRRLLLDFAPQGLRTRRRRLCGGRTSTKQSSAFDSPAMRCPVRLRRARQVAAASALQDASPSNGRRILPPRGHARPPGAMRPASEIVRLPAGPIRSRLSGRRAVTPPVRSGPCASPGRLPRVGRSRSRRAAIFLRRQRAPRSPAHAASPRLRRGRAARPPRSCR